MPRLLIEKGNDKGKTVPIPVKGAVIIGRDTSANVVIRDTMASRMHFKVEARDDSHWLVDLDSMNGTLHNNKPVKETKLIDGDLIKVGETLFSFIAADTTGDDPMIGTRLGGYKIMERVGRGGMGVVYRAEQVDLQRIVALKVISEENCKNKDFVELFVHEARAAAKLNHPNIVQVYDVKKHNDLYYFSMEFVPGGSVQDLLNKQKKISIELSVPMILDAARGLEYAHKKEIIHRDVKPDNFMLSESNSIKIGDLGLAQRLGEKLSADDENSVIGTPHYIAPEQVLGKPADYRSDIYALGATLYRMVAGFTPYQAPSIRDLINKKVREDAIPLHEACPGVPKRLGEICAKMMCRQPETRYQSMTEVVHDLDRLNRELRGEALPKEGTTHVDQLVGNRRLLMAALAAMILLVVGGGIAAVIVIRKPTPPVVAPLPPESTAEQDANRGYDAVRVTIARLDPNKMEDLEKTHREWTEFLDRHPKTKAAASAQRELESVSRRLRELKAILELANLSEQIDRANWTKMVQAFQAQDGRLDLSPIEATVQAYDAFRQGPNGKGTEAGADTERRVRHIAGWIDAVKKAREGFEKARGAARPKFDSERFQEAWTMLEEFKAETRQRKLSCPFSDDRYTTLLFDDATNSEQTKVIDAARGAYVKLEQLSQDYERRNDFKNAVDVLKPAVDHSIDAIRLKALDRQKLLTEDWVRFKKTEEERLRALERTNIESDQKDWDSLAKEVRKHVVDWSFKKAVEKLNAKPGDFPRTESFTKRRDDRIADLQKLVEFKVRFAEAYNDAQNGQKVSKVWHEPGLDGKLTKVTDTSLIIELDVSGTNEKALSGVKPATFAAFVKKGWTKMPQTVQIGFAVYCVEFGLYEMAVEELNGLHKGAANNQPLLDWIDRMKKAIETGDTSESMEVEAEKRFARLCEALESGDVDRARADIDVLGTRYAETKFVAGKRKEIDEIVKKLIEKGGEQFKKSLRDDQKKRIQTERANERSEATKESTDLAARLAKIRDAIDRDLQIGEFHAAWQDWATSTTCLKRAKDAVYNALTQSRENRKQLLQRMEWAYIALLRNCALAGAPGQSFKNEAFQRFTEAGAPELWTDAVSRFDKWEFDVQKNKKSLPNFVKALDDEPDAQHLWDLGMQYAALRNAAEARACFQALINVFPDNDHVKSGDATYMLAEACFALRDVKEALDLYRKMTNEFKNHPKMRDKDQPDSVPARVDACYGLMTQMYPEDKPKPKDK